MGAFAGEFAWSRWVVVAAFVLTAGLVLTRLAAAPAPVAGISVAHPVSRPRDHESDAAHLLMCLVMVAMLMFPIAASAAAQTVLTAMVAVFALLLAVRLPERHTRGPAAPVVFGYHLLAAGAMLYAMSGHHHGHRGPVAPLPALAVLFLADALLMLLPGTRRLLRHVIAHPAGSLAGVPHLVMDLGTAYMLLTAALG
ncbi:DUF5134 domain-containing protein [Nocardia sp. alder85J]|uniref:DUF5134 domain-containing protein n=1 Tax=Nocardia sp. alder85J TaxID=2862949 RepID=UPI001CD6B5D5|nr:DUF5134 domain-containing protein [Nocardia sp. alder85J]MCX4094900.1 DUF5134 domain-containing protein [Nocardia sp. alder85J]